METEQVLAIVVPCLILFYVLYNYITFKGE